MKLFFKYIKQNKYHIIFYLLAVAIFLCSFMLYHLPVAAVMYPAVFSLVVGALFIICGYFHQAKRHKGLVELLGLGGELMDELPKIRDIDDEDYQEIINMLVDEQLDIRGEMSSRYQDMMDYYTVWVHQIKTPIAAMRLKIQNEDSDFSRQLSFELKRIEQYVEMVMAFLRLESESTDYVIKEYDLDNMIKQVVKKYAGEFISRRLKLNYSELNRTVLTDEKWLCFVMEQLLSNALKYTREGSVSFYLEDELTLCIGDTGIGIAQSDLPRIFEKGYTGYNGRSDKKASGIGLYLCRQICDRLGHPIWVESVVDEGTVVKIDLSKSKLEVE